MKEIEKLADERCPSHSGVLVNICKGERWIYKEEHPVFAVTYSYCVGGYGIFGKVTSGEIVKKYLYDVFEDLRKEKINVFEFSCEEESLCKKILELFPGK